MENTKEEILDNLSEEINDIEGIKSRTLAWTIGLFSGLFIMVAGMLVLVMAQAGTINPELGSLGFRIAITGVGFYWFIRISNIVYTKVKNAKNKKGYERKYKSSDFDEEK